MPQPRQREGRILSRERDQVQEWWALRDQLAHQRMHGLGQDHVVVVEHEDDRAVVPCQGVDEQRADTRHRRSCPRRSGAASATAGRGGRKAPTR